MPRMMDTQAVLPRTRSGREIFKRSVTKPDGRLVTLYGYTPHTQTLATQMLDGAPQESHMRWHPLRKEWSVYASGRQNRTFKPTAALDPLAPTRPDGPATEIPFTDFELAVFTNRFPSFHAAAGEPDPSMAIPGVELGTARGHCDVVVYGTEATGSLATLSQARRVLLVHAWLDRYAALFASGAAYVLPFENRGEAVGVTLLHPHGQIYALPIVPQVQTAAAAAFAAGYDLSGGMRDWLPDYGISSHADLQVFAPPFARFPYEVWIASEQPVQGPWEFSDEQIEAFAALLGDVTELYDTFFGCACPYMLSLHAAPHGDAENWHFTAQFYPLLRDATKLKYLASVEQATGVFTVDVPPEATARVLRDTLQQKEHRA